MKKLIAGNWKMNTSTNEAQNLISSISSNIASHPQIFENCDLLVCPPFVYIPEIRIACGQQNISLGGQDCSAYGSGAYTGEISASMLKDSGCTYAIVGHSERREYHNETDNMILQKAKAAHDHGLVSIICVGESEEERDANAQEEIVERQLLNSIPETTTAENTVIAYEPVWAIGTGKTASPDDVADMHKFIRSQLQKQFSDGDKIRILYGGSMKPDNAKALLSTPNVDGGLIGGASLKADDFIAIAQKA